MAGNSLNQWSWSEILARHNKAGDQLLDEINLLVERHPILQDFPVRESNLINGEEFTMTTSLPQPSLHARGEGRAATKGQVQHGTDGVAWFTNQMRVNVENLEAAPNKVEFLRNEEMKYLEGMNQALVEMIFNGSTADEPKEFNGLEVRYDAIAANTVFDNGGTEASNLTDIWLIQPDRFDCCMIYPKGERGGVYRTPHPDTCLSTQTDSENAVSDAQKKVAWYTMVDWDWKGGLCLRDTRRIKRITNIHQDPDNAKAFDIRVFRKAKNAFDTPGQIYAYMHPDIRTQIENAADEKHNVTYPANQPFAVPIEYVSGIPIRDDRRITLTNNRVT